MVYFFVYTLIGKLEKCGYGKMERVTRLFLCRRLLFSYPKCASCWENMGVVHQSWVSYQTPIIAHESFKVTSQSFKIAPRPKFVYSKVASHQNSCSHHQSILCFLPSSKINQSVPCNKQYRMIHYIP